MKVSITIENIGGIWYVNGKRLGHDRLSEAEKQALENFIQEFKK